MEFLTSNHLLIMALELTFALVTSLSHKAEVTETKIHPSPLGEIEIGRGKNLLHSSPVAMKFTIYKRVVTSLRRLDFF